MFQLSTYFSNCPSRTTKLGRGRGNDGASGSAARVNTCMVQVPARVADVVEVTEGLLASVSTSEMHVIPEVREFDSEDSEP
jgi:hypothetical protein